MSFHPHAKVTRSCALRRQSAITLALLCLFTLAFALPGRAQLTAPTERDQTITRQVAKMLEHMHLSNDPINDAYSAKFWDAYLDALDPQKLYFLKADVDTFMGSRTKLDDQVRNGQLTFAFDVFKKFLTRVDERVAYAHTLIDQKHDFSVEESLVIDPDSAQYATTAEQLNDTWRRRIKYLILDKQASGETHADALDQLHKRYKSFQRRIHQTDNDELLQQYLTSLTTCYDPHSTYMSPATLENFNIAMSLELEGIGAQLRSIDGYTTVGKIIPGGAADKDGRLKAEDKIVGVGQDAAGEFVDVVEMKLNDVVKQIRGKAGTIVRLKIQSKGVKEAFTIKLERAKVELKDSEARGEIISEGKKADGSPYRVGVVNLPSFYMDINGARRHDADYRSTTRDVNRILSEFKVKGIDCIVIDLRANGGGSLTEAIRMTGLFVTNGPIVQVKDARGEVRPLYDEVEGTKWDGPLVVLTSPFSASASEIFAGAIQDYQRGLIVGNKTTHGKGTVQTLEDIGRQVSWLNPPALGALKITRQQFYRPAGDSTQVRGVVSDVELPSIFSHYDIGEASLDNALPFDRVPSSRFKRDGRVTRPLIEELRKLSAARVEASSDFADLQSDIQRYLKYKDRKSVSLNEKKFKAEYEEMNRDRAEPEDATPKETDPVVKRDFYFNEALAVTWDFVRLSSAAVLHD